MKLTLLLCALLLSAQAWCASGMPGENPFPHRLKKPLREKALYSKGKGTVGLILGITLGPIGYGAVHLFSHNQAQREKAKSGMIGWIAVVCTAGIVWACIAAKVSLDDFLVDFGQALGQAIVSGG